MDSQTEITMVMSSLSLGPTVEVSQPIDNGFNPIPAALAPIPAALSHVPAALAPLPAHAPLPVPLPVQYQRNRDVDVTYFFQPLSFFNEQ